MAPLRASFVAVLAALSTSVCAATVKRQNIAFELRANGTDGTAINANDGAFWIGKTTNLVCPGVDCSSFANQTSISLSNGNATMFAAIPSVQSVYIAPNGALSFTEPHKGSSIPMGSTTTGFAMVPDRKDQILVINGPPNDGFITCGADGQVFAIVQNLNCKGPSKRLIIYGRTEEQLGAFEYQ